MKRLFLLLFIFGKVYSLSFSQSIIIKNYSEDTLLTVNEFVLQVRDTLSRLQDSLAQDDSTKVLYGIGHIIKNVDIEDSTQMQRINYFIDSNAQNSSVKLFRIEQTGNLSKTVEEQEAILININNNRKRWTNQ
jgi:phage-related protein